MRFDQTAKAKTVARAECIHPYPPRFACICRKVLLGSIANACDPWSARVGEKPYLARQPRGTRRVFDGRSGMGLSLKPLSWRITCRGFF